MNRRTRAVKAYDRSGRSRQLVGVRRKIVLEANDRQATRSQTDAIIGKTFWRRAAIYLGKLWGQILQLEKEFQQLSGGRKSRDRGDIVDHRLIASAQEPALAAGVPSR
jgi:hypothetical protein